MGSRFLISGVQLGMLKALIEIDEKDQIKKILDVIKEQYVGYSDGELSSDVVRLHSNHKF